ncbi:MAG TPA: efflux RND transporter periplasmic adaptor subunit [Verrucomicrobiae bacterium]|nr:efflux RND transporter periplasmic adaptor subunit [Verrucomicrobiae bacterium]
MTFRFTACFVSLGLAAFLSAGCGRKHDAGDGHDHKHDKGEARGEPGHGGGSPGGASFKPGRGVILTDETRQSLGLETTEVAERKLPFELRFAAQVFGEDHKPTALETEHAECTGKASGLVAQEQAALLRAGQAVALASKSGEKLGGIVLGVNKALAIGDVEVVVGITNAGARLKPAEFLSASITLPRVQAVSAVPRSALLRAADGAFVYTVNGDAYFRTAVITGAETEGFVEIADGLFPGDVVVTKPVERLWLIELRATKGGGHSH